MLRNAEFVEVETGKGSDALDCESVPNFDPQPFHCKHLKDKRIENSPFPNEGLDLEEKALDEKGPADLEIVPVAATCRSSVKPFR